MSVEARSSRTSIRWLKFNAVGALGYLFQLIALAAFRDLFHLRPLPATAVAVELTVLHNYLWHEHYTWAGLPRQQRLRRALEFQASNGLISLVGNLAVVGLWMAALDRGYWMASALAILLCSTANFLVSDRLIFLRKRGPSPRGPEL